MGALTTIKSPTDCRCDKSRGCHLVDQLNQQALDELMQRTRPVTLIRGDMLFREGEEPAGIWVVCHGSIKTYRHAPDGRPLINRIAGPGDFVGHRSFFLNHPYEAGAAAMEPTLVRYFDRKLVEQLVFSEGSFSRIMLKQLAADLGHAEVRATHMAYGSARNRVIDVLHELCLAHKESVEHPEDLLIRRQDLAEIAGMAVETIVRVLKELEREGIVAIQGRHIHVKGDLAIRRLTD